MPRQRALVIGAGPSGLVAAKYLLADRDGDRYDVLVLESSLSVGGTFVNKAYEGCRLVSSKYITAYSDYRFGKDARVHPTAEEYVEYLRAYCDKFGLWGAMKFRCEVISVEDAPIDSKAKSFGDDFDRSVDSGGYLVTYRDKSNAEEGAHDGMEEEGRLRTEHFDLVAVCSGLHNVPYVPSIPNEDSFRGEIIHSCAYKRSSVFSGKRVLVLGSGETAMDIALRAVRNSDCKSVALSVRRGFLSIPHNITEGRPLDVFITNLFEHAYEHPWVHYLRLRWWLSTVVIRLFLLFTGSSVGFNQWACHTDPIKRGFHIVNKSHVAMAHLNVPEKRRTICGRFWMWVYGETGLRPIESFHRTSVAGIDDNGSTVLFEDGRRFDADLIMLGTGYKQSFPFLSERIKEAHLLDNARMENSNAASKMYKDRLAIDEDYLPSEHFIVSKTRPRLGFIGFVRPNVGAIPPMSELQVMWWLHNLRGEIRPFSPVHELSSDARGQLAHRHRPPTYMVLGRKYQYGVDYGNYMHRLAEDMDAAPTLSCLARSSQPLVALYTYCQGQAHVPLFRLRGPYATRECWETVTGELWSCVCDRGLAENVGLFAVTWVSMWINLVACAVEILWALCTSRRPQFFARYG